MDVGGGIIAGLRPVRGSVRLILIRWLIFIVAAAPGVLMAMDGIGGDIGRRAHFTDAGAPMPFFLLFEMVGEIPGAVWAGLVISMVGVFIANLFLTAGATAILDPLRSGRVRVVRTTGQVGFRVIWAYLRIAVAAFIALLVGMKGLGALFARIGDHGAVAGWTGETLALTLNGIRILMLLLWATIVGVFAWWARVIVVADGRLRVRRIVLMIPRLWWRHPIQAFAFHAAASIVTLVLGAVVLIAWRQSGSEPDVWIAVHLGVLLIQACVWHWRLRVGRIVWANTDVGDLRATSDAPWAMWSRLVARIRTRKTRAAAAL